MVCAAANAVIAEITERDLLTNCVERSDQFRTGLLELDGVTSVRGRGLLLGAMLDGERAGEVAAAALEQKLIVNAVRPDTVRFAPPLTITADEVSSALDRFATALS